MIDFSDKELLRKIDPKDAFTSTEQLIKQLRHAWEETEKLVIHDSYTGTNNIVFCGMGASIYGALAIKALEGHDLPPSEFVLDYHLPNYVDATTLVVLTSYSGSTVEVLSCAQEAKDKKAKMLILTKGGKLGEFAKENDIPAYIFEGGYNPSGVPRLGMGYSIMGLLGLFNKLNIISIEEREIADALTRLEERHDEIKAKATADFTLLIDHIPIIFGAEHLSANAQIFRNQCNEISKTFSTHFLVPDLNHHLMEGLRYPKNTPLYFMVLDSVNFSPELRKRMQLTTEVLKQNHQKVHVYETNGATLYDDVLEVLIYSSYVSLFLAMYYEQDPSANPYVDWFKEQLDK